MVGVQGTGLFAREPGEIAIGPLRLWTHRTEPGRIQTEAGVHVYILILPAPGLPVKQFPQRNGKKQQPPPALFEHLDAARVEIQGEAHSPAFVIQFQESGRPLAVNPEITREFGFLGNLGLSDQPNHDAPLVLLLHPLADYLGWKQGPGSPEEVVEDERPLDTEPQLDQVVVELDTVFAWGVSSIVLATQPGHGKVLRQAGCA